MNVGSWSSVTAALAFVVLVRAALTPAALAPSVPAHAALTPDSSFVPNALLNASLNMNNTGQSYDVLFIFGVDEFLRLSIKHSIGSCYSAESVIIEQLLGFRWERVRYFSLNTMVNRIYLIVYEPEIFNWAVVQLVCKKFYLRMGKECWHEELSPKNDQSARLLYQPC